MMTKKDELLFPWIESQIAEVLLKNNLQKKDLINLGIGDTCHSMPDCISKALHSATNLMSKKAIGYGPEQGRIELREKICSAVYQGFDFSKEEIFITEGIANSLSLLLDLFPDSSKIGVLSPTYPVYKTLIEATRKISIEVNANDNLDFYPPSEHLDCMILCSPNNPTGKAFSREGLREWIKWANDTGTLILYDGAYESFIFDTETPKSIFEITGAKTCAIELKSFSKSIGFSAMRLGYFVIAKELFLNRRNIREQALTLITAKTNGVSYLIQEAGIAALSPEGLKEIHTLSSNYMEMTKKLKTHLLSQNQQVIGGTHAPYLFWKIEGSCKEKFRTLLHDHLTITVPGIGFGREGYLRLSGFLNDDTLSRACSVLTSV